MQNVELGISGGAVMLPGTDTEKVNSMLFAPVTFDAGYHFALGEFFSVMPCVSLGFAYMELEYKSAAIPKNRSSFEPVGRAGAMVNYEFEYLQLSAGASYGFIYETSGLKPFVEVYIRAGAIIDL